MSLMKRMVMVAMMASLLCGSAWAQESCVKGDFQRGVFDHVGVNVSAGTEGIGVGLAAPVTSFLELEAGVNVMPGFKLTGDLNVPSQEIHVNYGPTANGVPITTPNATVEAKGDFARTTFNFKAHIYPFGGDSKFFVAAGFSFGGEKIAKVTGHSDELAEFVNRPEYSQFKQQILDQIGAQIDKYKIKFDDNLNISGDIRCNGFRPYLGLGCGRLVPKNRVGFRVEAGCQFMGKLKVYQNDEEIDISSALKDAGEDDISKFVENWKVYPVLKFSIVGRIL